MENSMNKNGNFPYKDHEKKSAALLSWAIYNDYFSSIDFEALYSHECDSPQANSASSLFSIKLSSYSWRPHPRNHRTFHCLYIVDSAIHTLSS